MRALRAFVYILILIAVAAMPVTAESWTVETTLNQNIVDVDGNGLTSAIYPTPIQEYNNNLYVTYLNSDRYVIVAKSTDDGVTWSKTQIDGPVADDGHNVCSLGIDRDGYIHVAYGMHADALNYQVSDSPESISAFTSKSMTGYKESECTYPRFIESPSGDLYFYIRDGTSIDGASYIKKYNSYTKTWSDFAPSFVTGMTSTPTACSYEYGPTFDAEGNIHFVWNWRTTSDASSNSNLCYAVYDISDGRWEMSNGTAYTLPITPENAEVIKNIPAGSGLANQGVLCVDMQNKPHVAYIRYADDGHTEVFHIYYTGATWIDTQVSDINADVLSGNNWGLSRPNLLIDSSNTAYVLVSAPVGTYTTGTYMAPPGTMYLIKSLNGWASWSDPMELGTAPTAEINYDVPTWTSNYNDTVFYYQSVPYIGESAPLYTFSFRDMLNSSGVLSNTKMRESGLGLESQIKINLPLNETGSTVSDISGNYLNGYGTSTGISKDGSMYQFLGSGYVNVSDVGSQGKLDFNESESFTVQATFRCIYTGNRVLISKYATGETPGYLIQIKDNKLAAFIRDGNVDADLDYAEIVGNTTITDDTIHTVTLTVDRGGYLNLYLDGVKDANPVPCSNVEGTCENNLDFVIGARGDLTLKCVYTYISDVIVIREALEPSEIHTAGTYIPLEYVGSSSGSYISPIYDCASLKTLTGLSYNIDLNGGSGSLIVQASNDRFITTSGQSTVNLIDGSSTQNLKLDGRYIRVISTLSTTSETPQLHSFTVVYIPATYEPTGGPYADLPDLDILGYITKPYTNLIGNYFYLLFGLLPVWAIFLKSQNIVLPTMAGLLFSAAFGMAFPQNLGVALIMLLGTGAGAVLVHTFKGGN